jgi:aminopeptidase N
MKFSKFFLLVALGSIAFTACKSKPAYPDQKKTEDPRLSIYRASVTKVNDIIHTELELFPDFAKREMKGIATLTVRPHFYPVDSLILNAKYMRIESVSIRRDVSGDQSGVFLLQPLTYTYDSLFLRIKLDKRYTKDDQYFIQINYVAQPEKVHEKGSRAISSDKGLYFINHDGKTPNKPIQLWTQGETEAASCWFPTIDAPNQKTSEKIILHCPSKYKSISNGALISSKPENDSTRIDIWEQVKPHSPYLFALVIGDFSETKDSWRGKEVNYYVEPEYAAYSKLVFGNTPEMLEFYSNILQVPYPWDKFHQVVVRDFVSGAMENTGCVIHYDRLQHDAREHLDGTYEDVVAHELFHHWFGDLVTCESWSNLPLNESFATYGEYLWDDYKYGRSEADLKLSRFHQRYIDESDYKQVELIRYHYKDKEDMFDGHSYQKGGSVLHMLRKYIGDEAFFAGIKIYLTDNGYKNAEISDLRKAFESVTGEDLNWFFDQWFMQAGHPHLNITHSINKDNGYQIKIIQKEKRFKLFFDVDVLENGSFKRQRLMLNKDTQVFSFSNTNSDNYVQFDAENQCLGQLEEIKDLNAWKLQFANAQLAAHKLKAFEQLMILENDTASKALYCSTMLAHPFWHCRVSALEQIASTDFSVATVSKFAKTAKLALLKEPSAEVRKAYVSLFSASKDVLVLKAMLNDSSFNVVKASLTALTQLEPEAAYSFANDNRYNTHRKMRSMVYTAIAKTSSDNESIFLLNTIEKDNYENAGFAATALANYLRFNPYLKKYIKESGDVSDQVLLRLEALAKSKKEVSSCKNALASIKIMYNFFYYQVLYIEVMQGMNKDVKISSKEELNYCKIMKKRLGALMKKLR